MPLLRGRPVESLKMTSLAPDRSATSWLRITLMVVGVLALIPLTILFGLVGFLGGLFFLLLAAFAK